MSEAVRNKSCVASCESASRAESVTCGRRYEIHARSKVAAGRMASVMGANCTKTAKNRESNSASA